MAIKVRHDGNAAAAAAAGGGAGAAKARIEAARLAQNQPQNIHQLSPAHTSAGGGGGGGAAPLAHAPAGASAASAPLTHAPAPSVGAPGARRGGAVAGGGTDTILSDYKVTGTDPFSRPDEYSKWDTNSRVWLRSYFPGEKEADVIRTTGAAKNDLAKDMYKYRHSLDMESMEQRHLLGLEGDIKRMLLKLPPGAPDQATPAVSSPFPDAASAAEPTAETTGVVDRTAFLRTLKRDYPQVLQMLDGLGEESSPGFEKAISVAMSALSDSHNRPGASLANASTWGGGLEQIFDSVRSRFGFAPGGDAATTRPRQVYAENDTATGGPSGPEKRYEASMGGMIDLLTHRTNGYS